MHPHTALPFVVEHAGGINKKGTQLSRMLRDAADNKPNKRASGLPSRSSKGFSNFLQPLPLYMLVKHQPKRASGPPHRTGLPEAGYRKAASVLLASRIIA